MEWKKKNSTKLLHFCPFKSNCSFIQIKRYQVRKVILYPQLCGSRQLQTFFLTSKVSSLAPWDSSWVQVIHLYGRSLHSDAEVFVRGDVRYTDSFILHICRSYRFVLVQVEYARHTDWLEGIDSLSLALCVSIRAVSSCVTGAETLLVWSGWRWKHIRSVFSHVLHQIRFRGICAVA